MIQSLKNITIFAPSQTKRKTASSKNSGLIMFLSYKCSRSII